MLVSEEITLREMTIEDYDQALAIWEQSDGICVREADSRESIRFFLHRNPGLSLVAENGGKIVGTVLGGHDGRQGVIYHLAVVREFRGQGIANLMVDECLRRLKEVGLHRCCIHVLQDNDPAIDFWTRTGWQHRDELLVFNRALTQEGAREMGEHQNLADQL